MKQTQLGSTMRDYFDDVGEDFSETFFGSGVLLFNCSNTFLEMEVCLEILIHAYLLRV